MSSIDGIDAQAPVNTGEDIDALEALMLKEHEDWKSEQRAYETKMAARSRTFCKMWAVILVVDAVGMICTIVVAIALSPFMWAWAAFWLLQVVYAGFWLRENMKDYLEHKSLSEKKPLTRNQAHGDA